MKAWLLSLEAILCGAPCFLLACGGLPLLAIDVYRALPEHVPCAAFGLALVVGIALAMIQYIDLAARTLDGRRYRFGPAFWLGGAGAALALGWIIVSFEWRLSAPVIGPIVVATLHFIVLQRRRER